MLYQALTLPESRLFAQMVSTGYSFDNFMSVCFFLVNTEETADTRGLRRGVSADVLRQPSFLQAGKMQH